MLIRQIKKSKKASASAEAFLLPEAPARRLIRGQPVGRAIKSTPGTVDRAASPFLLGSMPNATACAAFYPLLLLPNA